MISRKEIKSQNYIKIFILLILSILSTKYVITTGNTQQDIPDRILYKQAISDGNYTFQEITAKFDKYNKKIMIDGIIYDLQEEGIHLEEDGYKNMTNTEVLFCLVNVLIAVMGAGLMSGLTVGYLSIDEWDLKINLNKEYNDFELPQKKKYIEIAKVLEDRHWLLVTLLLCNSTAMEALPIFLSRLVNEFQAILFSVTAVLIFGEIIPQAFCCGPYQIDIAYSMSKPTKLLMYVTSPFSYPIARFLDWVIGEHKYKLFNNEELKVLVKLHTAEAVHKIIDENLKPKKNQNTKERAIELPISRFIQNVIDIKKIPVKKRFTKIEKVLMIDYETTITSNLVKGFIERGISRLPVTMNQNKNEIIGYIRTIDFLKINLNGNISIKDKLIDLHTPIVAHPNSSAFELFSNFKKGNHLAIISEQKEILEKKLKFSPEVLNLRSNFDKIKSQDITIIGIATLEDILESIIGTDIRDESEIEKSEKIVNRFKNQIDSVVNDVIAQSIKRTMTMKSEGNWYERLKNKDEEFDYNDDSSFNYNLMRDQNHV